MFALVITDPTKLDSRYPTLEAAQAAAVEALENDRSIKEVMIFDLGDERFYFAGYPDSLYPLLRCSVRRRGFKAYFSFFNEEL